MVVPDYMVPALCPRTPAPPPPPRLVIFVDSGVIRGRVLQEGSSIGVAGGRAGLGSDPRAFVSTDTAGYFRLNGVPEGLHFLTILAVGYAAFKDTVEVRSEPGPDLTVRLRVVMFDGPCSGFSVVRVARPRRSR
jgi:hypothetical protein